MNHKAPYSGPIQLVIADLAGTTVDFGSCAPAGSFIELFARRQIDLSQAEARGPMGLNKRDHIHTLMELPRVRETWREVTGRAWTEADVDALYEDFIPLQLACLPDFSEVIEGVVETVEVLNHRNIQVAATTGYNRDMLHIVLDKAAEQGFVPQAALCAGDVPFGRPAPWMIFHLMEQLNVYPGRAVVKIGDTIADIEAGLNAGVWTVGVTVTGNLMGLSRAEYEALSEAEQMDRKTEALETYQRAGAHEVIDSFADLPEALACIERRQRESKTASPV
jgi:phosphonoacetaldehyde hydrolase